LSAVSRRDGKTDFGVVLLNRRQLTNDTGGIATAQPLNSKNPLPFLATAEKTKQLPYPALF
jgi:hypothetical protein